MSSRYVYDTWDDRIIPLIELPSIDYFIGSNSNINSSLKINSEVEKTVLNDLGEEEKNFYQLVEPKYEGDEITRLNGYSENKTISETCFLNPNDYVDFFYYEDVGIEPKLLDFFTEDEINFFSSLPTYDEENGFISV